MVPLSSPAPILTSIRTRWSSPSTDDQFVVQNPATGQTVTVVQGAGPDEVDQAVRAAHGAHLRWKRRSARERGRCLRLVAEAVRAHADELAALESLELGTPIAQARELDVQAAAGIFDRFAGAIEEPARSDRDDLTTLEPYGVIAGFVPFARPSFGTAATVAPALAVGNAVVLRPPEQAPSVVLRMVELIRSVLPDRVLHATPGRSEVGAALAGNRLVGKVAFAGPPRTGAAVLRTVAPILTPALIEPGGRNPMVVLDDADQRRAVLAALDGGFFDHGAPALRILVQHSAIDEFEDRLSAVVRRLRVGDGADPRTDVGPLPTRAQQEQTLDYLSIGVAEGARIAAQAPVPEGPPLADGFFVAPTVLTDVTPRMRVAREEFYGPVVTLTPFTDEDEAVRIANGARFARAAAVFTRDDRRALEVGRRMRANAVLVNTGVGRLRRENPREELAEYGYTKTIRLADGAPYWPAAARALEG
ncbi:aldehyde dehydrogenase family protein [Mycobacterium sp. Marseille-P9652]|uniref:aldehyde dehydrogenase family protein n=1 Tax=Mycobacterium sp. Marseille-P9652 TaxID=2654950 RepID=UPI002106AD2D|nr:aldehyde dehydrogenase family protein [Mycobacterium sp. Marseille-P9652]